MRKPDRYRRPKTTASPAAASSFTTKWPVRGRPFQPRWVTVRSRRSESGTGQPRCHAPTWISCARTAGDSGSALKLVDERRPSLVLLDVWLHGSPMDGLEVLDAIKLREPQLPVIIFSGHGNIDTAVSAISRGAVDFIEKPFEAERLLLLVARATETERLRRENARLREGIALAEEFTGNSSAINQVRAKFKFDGAEPDTVRQQVVDGYHRRNTPGDREALDHLLRRQPPTTP